MHPYRTMLAPACAVLLLLLAATCAIAAEPQPLSPAMAPLRFFLGSWVGEGHGQPGTSAVERDYKVVLGGRFIEAHNKSTYAPQEKNPKGEIHQDIGFFDWDRARHRFTLRQFHVEGFVNQYVADSVGAAPDSLVFTSEAIENIPPGYRARETYRILGPNEFVERFELAEPGAAFALYSESRLRRKP